MDSGVENQVVLDLFSEWLSFNKLRSTLSVLRAGDASQVLAAWYAEAVPSGRQLHCRLSIGPAAPHHCLS